MLVALAGPASNLILAVVFTLLFKLLYMAGVISDSFVATSVGEIIINIFLISIQFNVLFAVFNMLPIPPFDGSKVLFYFLPYKYKDIMYKIEQYSFFILLILLFSGLARVIISPFVNAITSVLWWIISL
ncbi:Peptidase family M50 [compost metagenome]